MKRRPSPTDRAERAEERGARREGAAPLAAPLPTLGHLTLAAEMNAEQALCLLAGRGISVPTDPDLGAAALVAAREHALAHDNYGDGIGIGYVSSATLWVEAECLLYESGTGNTIGVVDTVSDVAHFYHIDGPEGLWDATPRPWARPSADPTPIGCRPAVAPLAARVFAAALHALTGQEVSA